MSDWDFLYEMRDRGYSNDEIMEAMACGYAPWQYPKPLFEYEDDYYYAVYNSETNVGGYNKK